VAEIEYTSLKKAAECEARTLGAQKKYAARHKIVLLRDPNDRRRRLFPVAALTPQAYQLWLKDQARIALERLEQAPASGEGSRSDLTALARTGQFLQPSFPFAVPQAEQAETDEEPPDPIPQKFRALVDRRIEALGQTLNHGWMKYRGQTIAGIEINSEHEYVCALARLQGKGFSISNLYAWKKVAREVFADSSIPRPQKWATIRLRLMPGARPGRSGHHFFTRKGNEWQWPVLQGLYLKQAKPSVRRAWELLLEEIERRERAAEGHCIYERPTLNQCRMALLKIPPTHRILGREGDKRFNDRCAPYITRRPPEYSGAVVGTDGKLLDILCRDAGWRVGRIWWVAFADVAAERWLGHAFGPAISGDMVMDAAAMMLEEACIPGAVQIDRGKEFQGNRFTGGYFRISGEKLFAEMEGLWERLGVKVISAIGRNPQTKPIERLFRSAREFEQSWPTYTGPNPQERPPHLALIEKQIEEFKAGKAPPPPVPTIEQVVRGLIWWCTQRWNAQHRGRGRYRQGMTPDEAWNVKRPPDGFRRLTRSEVDHYTADHRYLKVLRGGEVHFNLRGHTFEYFAAELFDRPGDRIEVVINRRELARVNVIYPIPGGTASCVAELKDALPWGSESRDEVRLRLRCIAALKRTKKQSLKRLQAATDLLPEAPYLTAGELAGELAEKQLINSRQLFGAPAALNRGRKRQPLPAFNHDAARAVLETMEGR
jgi:hypothetical protein